MTLLGFINGELIGLWRLHAIKDVQGSPKGKCEIMLVFISFF